MSLEGQLLDQKSLRIITGKTADWDELAKDCVAFANATGGHFLLGIEDGQDEPPPEQRIPVQLPHAPERAPFATARRNDGLACLFHELKAAGMGSDS